MQSTMACEADGSERSRPQGQRPPGPGVRGTTLVRPVGSHPGLLPKHPDSISPTQRLELGTVTMKPIVAALIFATHGWLIRRGGKLGRWQTASRKGRSTAP